MFGSRAGRAQTGREAASVFRKDPFRRDPRKSRGTCVVEGRDDDKGKGRSSFGEREAEVGAWEGRSRGT